MIDLPSFCLLGGHPKKSQCFQGLFKNLNMFWAAIRPHAFPCVTVYDYGCLLRMGSSDALFLARIGVIWRTFNPPVDLASEHGVSGRVSTKSENSEHDRSENSDSIAFHTGSIRLFSREASTLPGPSLNSKKEI
jgi:hypothetical protein